MRETSWSVARARWTHISHICYSKLHLKVLLSSEIYKVHPIFFKILSLNPALHFQQPFLKHLLTYLLASLCSFSIFFFLPRRFPIFFLKPPLLFPSYNWFCLSCTENRALTSFIQTQYLLRLPWFYWACFHTQLCRSPHSKQVRTLPLEKKHLHRHPSFQWSILIKLTSVLLLPRSQDSMHGCVWILTPFFPLVFCPTGANNILSFVCVYI